MKKFTKVLSAVLASAMVLGLCACGGKGGQGSGILGGKGGVSSDPSLAKQNVYRMEEYDLSSVQGKDDDSYIQSVKEYDGRIYMLLESYNWEKGNDYVQKLVSMGMDGTDIAVYDLQTAVGAEPAADEPDGGEDAPEEGEEDTAPEDNGEETAVPEEGGEAAPDIAVEEPQNEIYEYTGFGSFTITNSGYLYGMKNYNYENYSDPENPISKRENYVCCWDLEGKMLWETPIEGLQTDESWSYVNGVVGLKDGQAALLISGDKSGQIMVDAQGALSELKPMGDEMAEFMDRSANWSVTPDGVIVLIYYDEEWKNMYIRTYDMSSDSMSEETMLPSTMAYNGMSGMTTDANGDLLYTTQKGVFKYHVGDAEPTLLMSFVNSDMEIRNLDAILPIDDEHFVAMYSEYDEVNYHSHIVGGMFTKVDPKDIPDKEVMVLAGNYIPSDMRKRAVEYNKASQTHRIVLKDYSEYQTYDDYSAGITQMNNDIISGSMPDILIVEGYSDMALDSYIAKGLLADIGKLIEEDEELSQVEFMENVFEACKVDGKLYEIIPAFNVSTYIGKTSLVGEREGWTMDEAQQLLATLPEGTSLFGEMSNISFLNTVMAQCGNDFVDISTGKCSFESPEFIALMEYAKTLPTEEELQEQMNGEEYNEQWYRDYQNQYRENRTLLSSCYIGDFENMVYIINGSFGEDVSFVGFPGSSGRGAVINTNTTYALSARSANLDAAWDFMRYYLTEEYQSELGWQLPITKKIFDENAQRALQKPYYEDENGEKVEYEYTYWMNDEEIILDPLTQAQVDEIKNFVSSVNKRSYSNTDIMNILTEEMEAFFSGQKSAADVAKIIQSRAQVFVNENR